MTTAAPADVSAVMVPAGGVGESATLTAPADRHDDVRALAPYLTHGADYDRRIADLLRQASDDWRAGRAGAGQAKLEQCQVWARQNVARAVPHSMCWVVTTSAGPDVAAEVTGIAGWSLRVDASTWVTPSRDVAAGVTAQLRDAGHIASMRQGLPDEGERVLATLAQIGAARAAEKAAAAEVRRLAVEFDEATLMRTAKAFGATVAEIARRAGCDRQWVYQQTRDKGEQV